MGAWGSAWGGGGGGSSLLIGHNTLLLGERFGYTLDTGTSRTVGNVITTLRPMWFAGVRTYQKHSGGPAPDVWKASVWAGNNRRSASFAVAADGYHVATFGAPLLVPAYTEVAIGVFCTSAAQYTRAVAGAEFANGAPGRLVPPLPGDGFIYKLFGAIASNDAAPSFDTFTDYNTLFAVEPIVMLAGDDLVLTNATKATLAWDGDSFTEPQVVAAADGYAALVGASLGRVNVVNAGLGGQKVEAMTARFATYVAPAAAFSPAPVLIAQGGYNNMSLDGGSESAAAVYAKILTYVSAARAAGFVKIVWQHLLPVAAGHPWFPSTYNAQVASLNAMIDAGPFDGVVSYNGVTVARAADGLHPNEAGHATMAARIAAVVAGL